MVVASGDDGEMLIAARKIVPTVTEQIEKIPPPPYTFYFYFCIFNLFIVCYFLPCFVLTRVFF